MASPTPSFDILKSWGLTAEELSEIVAENPSMRGLMFGFVAEYKVKCDWLMQPEISNLTRPRSHDRKAKGDFKFDYCGESFTLEVKCLDTPKVRGNAESGFSGTFQCNASDTTKVVLPDGSSVITNCLSTGGFDVLAVCHYAFSHQWRYAFAMNEELPHTTWHKYTPAQQKYLLKSTMRITWPLAYPFTQDLFSVLDRVAIKRRTK